MKKKIVIISGFSGVGKGSVIYRLMEIDELVFKDQSKIWLSVSDTSRTMRNKEDNYNFVSITDYQKRVNEGYYLEYNVMMKMVTELQESQFLMPLATEKLSFWKLTEMVWSRSCQMSA